MDELQNAIEKITQTSKFNKKVITTIPRSTEEIPIDIIVPAHGRLDLTMNCVRAIYKETSSPFHLIVIDDTDITDKDNPDALINEYFERFKKTHDNLTYIHNDKPFKCGNEFFNLGFKYCKYDYVALIMNSITVEQEWDAVAVNVMKMNPDIGIIGFKTLLPSGVIESAGITMMGFTPIDIGRDAPGHRQTSMYECIAIQWAFALLRRKAAEGNLDEKLYHGFVGWDDIDNSFVLRSKGWRIYYCGLGVGYHETRATRGKDTLTAMKLNRENAEMFYKRWGYDKLYKKASSSKTIQDKGKIAEEMQGLTYLLRSQG